MASSLKPIKIWGKGGPNPPKIPMVCEELDIPYEIVDIPFSDVKGDEYTAINPNGRLPSIHDPNTDITLWESGAIILYLTEKYDTKHKISFPRGSPESYHADQWLFYQVSGQGPYYGNAVYFEKFHHEKIPGAVERFVKEINRVSAVLEGQLARQKKKHSGADGPWLVGDKYSYADLPFLVWQILPGKMLADKGVNASDYPLVQDWIKRIVARPSTRKVMEGSEQLKPLLADF